MHIHELKIAPEFYYPAFLGHKYFEIREAKDRYFEPGDGILLREYIPTSSTTGSYTGRELKGVITYVTTWGQQKGYVVFGWKL